MTTTDRLARIRARCVELLEIASKRTPGKWNVGWESGKTGPTCPSIGDLFCGGKAWEMTLIGYSTETIAVLPAQDPNERGGNDHDNAAYIAACAGAAEAGWKATIASIDALDPRNPDLMGVEYSHEDNKAIAAILAAWSELA